MATSSILPWNLLNPELSPPISTGREVAAVPAPSASAAPFWTPSTYRRRLFAPSTVMVALCQAPSSNGVALVDTPCCVPPAPTAALKEFAERSNSNEKLHVATVHPPLAFCMMIGYAALAIDVE